MEFCIVISDLNVYLFYFLKHHCRKCGAVVCGPCSNKKFLLPVQSAKPLRVCLTCHDVLTKTKNNGGPNVSLSNSNIIAFLLYSCNIKFCVFVRRGPEHGFFWWRWRRRWWGSRKSFFFEWSNPKLQKMNNKSI